MTMERTVPESVLPEDVTVLVTATAMYAGMVAGGLALLPGRLVQVMPQAGGVPVSAAKPLKLAGAAPPERVLRLDQASPHQVTAVPAAAVVTARSPSTKAPAGR